MKHQRYRVIHGWALGAVFGLFAASGHAEVIDTLSSWDMIYNVNSFGEGATPTYGQTLTVPTDNILQNFTFKLLQGGGNSTTIRFFVQQWAGNQVTGPVLFQTGSVTLLNTGFYENYQVNTGGLTLTTGQQYGLFFTSFLDENGFNDASLAAAHHHDTNPYVGGRFVFNNNAHSFAALESTEWNIQFLNSGDLAFQATFTSVPEPSSGVILLLVGVLAAVFSAATRGHGAIRRR